MELTIKQIFNQFGNKYMDIYNTNYEKINIFNNIKTCRTKEQGIRIYKCHECGKKMYTYKSCLNRHCPTCLEYKKEMWIEKHKIDTLDINYYHIVLCLPRELFPLFYYNQKIMYHLLFKISSETIMEVCYEHLGLKIGVTSILHTWSQKGKYYPHIHMLVTGGGINKLGKWTDSKLTNESLIKARFKNKLIKCLKKLKLDFYGSYSYLSNYDKYISYIENIKKLSFICYKKEPYSSVNDIYEYFGKYLFRVCITNDRIISIDDKYVYFKYKDYADKNIDKISRVKGEEFIRRFLLHTLTKSFVKVRYYGIMSCKNKKKKMKKLKLLTKTKIIKRKFIDKINILKRMLGGKDITKCPKCHGKLYLYKEINYQKPPSIK